VRIAAFHDLERPAPGRGDGGGGFGASVASVGEDALDERKPPPRLLQHRADRVAILDVGGQDGDAQQQPERIDKDVALAARDLLRRIVARRIERPPFCAVLALWLSTIAALGLASRPAWSRTAR
jgi:hypothetical protein